MFDIIFSDLKKHLLIGLSIIAFAFVASFIISLGLMMSWSLLNQINETMEKGKTPHFLQMHSGTIDNISFSDFESNPLVEEFQILPFLNIDNNEFLVDGKIFIFSSDDNGVTIQGKDFDFLLSEDGMVINPKDGIYVPSYYKKEVPINSKLTICGKEFVVEGYLIDSQMGSSLSSSKRFLISEENYLELKEKGREEYLIEARCVKADDANKISNIYALSDLPKDGPAVTYNLIKLMNALSDGIMIILIILSGILAIVISLISLRYIFLISIERDSKRIALIQAIGLRREKLVLAYTLKYLILLLLGNLLSFILLLFILNDVSIVLLLGIHFIILLILSLWDFLIMKKISKIEILDELRNKGKKTNGIISLILVGVLTTFMYYLAFIPACASSTLSSKDFVSSMGIGSADIRIDLKGEKREAVEKYLDGCKEVESYAIYDTYRVKVDVNSSPLLMLIEEGNHELFPIKYSKGHEPRKDNEIALSQLLASECNLELNETINIQGKDYLVVGIYSDITNGGKSAKAKYLASDNPIWSIAYVNSSLPEIVVLDIQKSFSKVKADKIENYVISLYGNTIESINKAKDIAFVVCIFIEAILITLVSALTVERESKSIALKMAIGIRKSRITKLYILRNIFTIIVGILFGIVLAITTGGSILSLMLSFLGGSNVEFKFSIFYSLIALPFVMIFIAIATSFIGLITINKVKTNTIRGGLL